MADTAFTEADNGKSVSVSIGARVSLRLPENGTTGYQWSLQDFQPGALTMTSDTFTPPGGKKAGAGGVREFVFSAKAAGSVTLALKHARSWEEGSKAASTFRLKVTVS